MRSPDIDTLQGSTDTPKELRHDRFGALRNVLRRCASAVWPVLLVLAGWIRKARLSLR